jgi:hypothetical protein
LREIGTAPVIQPRPRGGFATFPAALPATPAGPPALSCAVVRRVRLARLLPIPTRLRRRVNVLSQDLTPFLPEGRTLLGGSPASGCVA